MGQGNPPSEDAVTLPEPIETPEEDEVLALPDPEGPGSLGNRLAVVAVVLVFAGLLAGMGAVSNYLAGDWRNVQDCSETYWTCFATVGGLPRSGGSLLVPSERLARSCREYEAWESSVRRASFDCSMSRSVVGGTCRIMEVECELPGQLY